MNLAAWRIREWRPEAQEQHRGKERCIQRSPTQGNQTSQQRSKDPKDPKERVKEASPEI
jgi:hypothetical protein